MTLAEGMMLVRQEVEIAEVSLSSAEEYIGAREIDDRGGAVVEAGSTRVPFVGEG